MDIIIFVLQRPSIFYKTFSELSTSFRDGYSWWPAMELCRRLILVVFIVAFPGNNVSKVNNNIVAHVAHLRRNINTATVIYNYNNERHYHLYCLINLLIRSISYYVITFGWRWSIWK